MNRRIRDPNVRWCERRTPVYGRSRLLDLNNKAATVLSASCNVQKHGKNGAIYRKYWL